MSLSIIDVNIDSVVEIVFDAIIFNGRVCERG